MTPDTGPEPVGTRQPSRSGQGERGRRPASPAPFMVTKEHRRFAEFANAVAATATSACATARRASAKPCPPGTTPDRNLVDPYLRAFRLMESVPAPEQALAARALDVTRRSSFRTDPGGISTSATASSSH